MPFLTLLVREGYQQNTVGGCQPDAHHCSHERRNIKGGLSHDQHPKNPRQRTGQRRDDDQGIEPGLEVHHHQQVHQNDGEPHAST